MEIGDTEHVLTETSESPKQDSTARKIAWGVLSFLAGAALPCALATLNKRMIGAPMVAQGFLVPLLLGGAAGLAIGLLFLALRQRFRKLEAETTRLRRVEKALREYAHMVAATTDFMSFIDSDLIYRAVNETYLTAHGKTREEIVGHAIAEIVDDGVFEHSVKANLNRCLAGETARYQAWFELAGSGRRYLDVVYHPYREAGGSVSGVVVSARDITERKQAEDAIRRRERYLAALNDAVEALLAPADTVPFQEFLDRIGPVSGSDWAYVFMNHGGSNGGLWMSPVAEWCAEGISSQFDNPFFQDMSVDEWLPRWKENLQRNEIATGRVADFLDEHRDVLDPLGIQTILHIPLNVDTEFVGLIGFAYCASERGWEVIDEIFLRAAAINLVQAIRRARSQGQVQRYADRLEDLVDMRTAEVRRLGRQRTEMEKLAATGRMAAGIAHEINNPLAGIKNAFMLVKEGVPEHFEHHEFVDMIEKEIDRIALIVSQMGLLYQPAAGVRRLQSLRPILEDISRVFDARIRQHKLTLSVDIDEDLPDVRIIDNHLRQVIYNILDNAIHAAPAGSDVSISCEQVRDAIQIGITDRGDGIADDILPRIFEPFFTTKITEDEGGMGLGLAVSHSMTRAMGGKLTVRTTVGEGTTFIVEFPIDGVSAPIQQEGDDHE